MLKKPSMAFSTLQSKNCDFRIASIFKNLKFLKMAMHPCIVWQAAEKRGFSTASSAESRKYEEKQGHS